MAGIEGPVIALLKLDRADTGVLGGLEQLPADLDIAAMVVTDLGNYEAVGAVSPDRVPSDVDLSAHRVSRSRTPRPVTAEASRSLARDALGRRECSVRRIAHRVPWSLQSYSPGLTGDSMRHPADGDRVRDAMTTMFAAVPSRRTMSAPFPWARTTTRSTSIGRYLRRRWQARSPRRAPRATLFRSRVLGRAPHGGLL